MEEQIASAQYVAGALHSSIGHLTRQARYQEKTRDILTTNAWVPDIARAIILGRTITIESIGPMATSVADPKPGLRPSDRLSLGLRHLLHDIAPREHQVVSTIVVQDGFESIRRATFGDRIDTHRFLMPHDKRRQHMLDLWRYCKQEGVIEPTDVAGKDYRFISTANFIEKSKHPGGVIHDLQFSTWGKSKTKEDTSVIFQLGAELQSLYYDPDSYARFGDVTIRLADKYGLETANVLYAEAIRETLKRSSGIHIIGPTPDAFSVTSLLRAIDVIDRSRFHVIGVQGQSWSATTPDHYTLDVARQLEQHTHQFIANRRRFANFESFNAPAYAERHYGGETALKEDQDICKVVAFVLSKLDVQAQRAADIGCGPNPYPGMLLLPHAQKVDLLEYAPTNRDYMQAFFSGALSHNHTQMWRKFEDYMVTGGGEQYVGVFNAIREAGKSGRVVVQPGDIFKLPKDRWDLASAYFVIDSIGSYLSDQHDAIASLRDSLTEEGIAVIANMLNNEDHNGYPAGDDQEYPNISQTIGQMKQAYTDNDMFSLIVKVGHGRRIARDGYDGMALVFACNKNSERQQQLLRLVPALHELGFTEIY